MSADQFKAQLHEVAMMQRRLGHNEFRIAAMRMFEQLNMAPQGVAIGLMEVDRYLTAEEIAERERMP
jgi:hypothetical protein